MAAAQPRMLAIAGREADIVNLQGVATTGGVMSEDPTGRSAEATAGRIERVRAAAGDRFDQVEISLTIAPIVTDRPRDAAEELARARGWGLSAEQVLAMPSVVAGPPDRIAELLHERRDAFGISYFIASDSDLAVVEQMLMALVR
jgi:alkanesulfonate monooxygenase SsuD/methylene tetrahydromethanopterin reductase-like flavin-dependent oxidoreductase (luciferase family)